MGKKQLFTQKDLEELNEELNKQLNLDRYKSLRYRGITFDNDNFDWNSVLVKYDLLDITREESDKIHGKFEVLYDNEDDSSKEDKIESLNSEWSPAIPSPIVASQADMIREKILMDLSRLENDALSSWKKFREFESSILDLCHNLPSLRQYIDENKSDIHMSYTANKIIREIGEIIKTTAKISESLSRVDCATEHDVNENAGEIIEYQMEMLKNNTNVESPEIETAGIDFLDRDEDEE